MSTNSVVHCDLDSNTWPTKLIPKCSKFRVIILIQVKLNQYVRFLSLMIKIYL